MSTTIARLYNWVTDKANGVKITASRQDGELDQMITALNRKVLCASSAPSSPITGQSWVDTSGTIPILKTYNGTTWDVVGHGTGANIVSASSVTFGSDGDSCTITGTTTITAFASMPAGTLRFVTFSGILTLTYNGTSLILPNGTSNITTAAGDSAIFLSLGSGNWKCLHYQAKAGGGGPSAASAAEVKTGTEAAKYVAPSTMVAHEGVCKGWINLNGTGTIAIRDSFNVTSITDNTTGDYTVTWDTDFATADYAASAICHMVATDYTAVCIDENAGAMSAGSLRLQCSNMGNVGVDPVYVLAIAIGDR